MDLHPNAASLSLDLSGDFLWSLVLCSLGIDPWLMTLVILWAVQRKKNKRKQKTLQQPSADDGSADCSVPGSDDLPMEEWAYWSFRVSVYYVTGLKGGGSPSLKDRNTEKGDPEFTSALNWGWEPVWWCPVGCSALPEAAAELLPSTSFPLTRMSREEALSYKHNFIVKDRPSNLLLSPSLQSFPHH